MNQLSGSLAEVRSWHRPLMIMVAAMSVLVVVASVGLLSDDRELMQASVWAKPLKFGMSFVIYGATLAWLLPKLRRARRTMWTLGTVFAVTGLIDVGFIAVQAARGTYSHFNVNTDTFNQIGQVVFSSGVVGLFGASLLIAVMLLFHRVGDPALTWSLRVGIGLSVIGMALASFIRGQAGPGPRTAEDAYGNPVTLVGQHGVGAPDGDGMAITNWSTVGGDLRVPHFIGLHSIQVFVLAVLLLTALAGRISWLRSERVRTQLAGVVILGYTALFTITVWQAVRGQSLVRPDAATWTALAVTVVVTALLATLAISAARRSEAVPAGDWRSSGVRPREPVGSSGPDSTVAP
ncbi:hypothetical protein OG400_19390 [Micromonospora ureilytica]|uniref:hypothetical protein n=1 Tax=Micromonospora ureilytica TaxID=709868 RepID=UPI002E15E180|nr:hypothetical protein OG400_19390 [Micromonospora ureilytica]